ncbi:MAG: hypothetical protein ABFD69_05840 [Candidatus Sumerlaeia bacterium]
MPRRTKILGRYVPAILAFAGVCCALVPLIYFVPAYLNQRTVVDALKLKEPRDIPTIPVALVLTYLSVIIPPKRSFMAWIGALSFLFAVMVAIATSMAYLLAAIFCFLALILDLALLPSTARWHYILPFACLFLGAVGTPNIGWAPVRSAVSRVQSEMREISVALESYHLANDCYPPCTNEAGSRSQWNSKSAMPGFMGYEPGRVHSLTTPIAYLPSLPSDRFGFLVEDRTFSYYRWDDRSCILISAGPNCVFDISPDNLPELRPTSSGSFPEKLINLQYDPTNGTVSAGDILRIQFAEGIQK